MAYDEELAERMRRILTGVSGVAERKMFGGLAFMVNGNMAGGIIGADLMVRVGAEAHSAALAQPHARPMDFTGRPLRGMVYVAPAGVATDEALAAWLAQGVAYARSLPPKGKAAGKQAQQ